MGGWSHGTGFITPNTTSAYTYTGYIIPNTNTLLNKIPNSTTATMTATLYTYNSSGTQIGSASSKTFTVTVPSNIKPTVGTFVVDPGNINGKNILVQGKNKIKVEVSGCSAGTGSTIKSYTFSGPGISSTTTNTSVISSSTISTTGTLSYTVTVTDTRGRTASKTQSIYCFAYATPSFSSFNAYRAKDTNGTVDLSNGRYLYCTYEAHASGTQNALGNTITVTAFYKKSTGTSFSMKTIKSDTTTSKGSVAIDLGNATDTYQVYLQVTDKYGGTQKTSAITVFGSSRIMNITKDGAGFAIGKMSEKTNSNTNGLFECKWDAKFYGAATGPSGFSTSSDERVKKNIKDINTNIVDGLRPVQYELSSIDDGKIHYGFVAQEVAKLLDDMGIDAESTGVIGYVINNGQQEYVLTYTEFVPLLTKKCQDLQSEIDMLKQEIYELKNNIVK